MNLNTRDIVVVHIGFHLLIIFDFASEVRGRKSIFEKCSFLEHFFRHNTLFVNILLKNIEQKLFNFKRSFIWFHLYKPKGVGPLNRGLEGSKVFVGYLLNYKYFVIGCRSQQSESSHTIIKVIPYVIRDLRDQNRKSVTSNISKTIDILQSIIEQKLFRIHNMHLSIFSCLTPLRIYRFGP